MATLAFPLAGAENSEPSRIAHRSLLLSIGRAGNGPLLAVGERGHVIKSTDEGATWTQCLTPTRATLTGVSFADDRTGWVVGHDGVILFTSDGGATWTRQDKGDDLDTVYLDVLALGPKHAIVIGAYGKFVETTDGGLTWNTRSITGEDLHLNRIARHDGANLYIAGEAGTLLLSHDGGAKWSKAALDYEGSLFGVRPLTGGVLVAFGLRAHIFVSTDEGANWEARETDVKVPLMAGVRLRDGVTVLAGQGGNFYISRDSGRSFHHWKPDNFGTSVADLAVTREGSLLTVGEGGVHRLAVP